MSFAPIHHAGRLLLALPFIVLGWDAAKEPGPRTQMAASIGVPEPELAVRANGYTMVAAGIALALGILPRWAAAALASSLVPTSLAGHPFWQETDPMKRKQQQIHFLKNVSMIGGLLLFATRRK